MYVNMECIPDMKRLFIFCMIGLVTALSAYPLSRDYYLKQAESYQREAKYYFNQAEGYERDAEYYNVSSI